MSTLSSTSSVERVDAPEAAVRVADRRCAPIVRAAMTMHLAGGGDFLTILTRSAYLQGVEDGAFAALRKEDR